MTVERPIVRVGIQINNIKALPVEFFVVDDGPAPLLLGSEFIKSLFNAGPGTLKRSDQSATVSVRVESESKYAAETIGIRLVPEKDSIDALQLERFLRGVREIHNVAVISNTGLHQHDDWPGEAGPDAKRNAVRATIENDGSLASGSVLEITWIEAGSIWLSLASGSKAALSWIAQIFDKSMDARLRASVAGAAAAEEDAEIKRLTREEIARARSLEARRASVEQIRKTREEWRRMILAEVDFREKLKEKIRDDVVREQVGQSLDKALKDVIDSDFLPVIENIPKIPPEERDQLPAAPKRQRGQFI
jgi:hypothetical protein